MELEELLKKYFKYESFKKPQKELILKITSFHDALAILPTGFGKSLIYQISGLYLGGLTLVISPLISLMKDQVDNLNKRNIKACYINSLVDFKDQLEIYDNLSSYSFLYVSPERLESKLFRSKVNELSLIVIDEAHTLLWGLEFRTSMTHIKDYINGLAKRPPVAAFTATLGGYDVDYIIKSLSLKKPYIKCYPPIKKNINIKTIRGNNDLVLDKLLKKHSKKKIIIYTLTRLSTMRIYTRYKDIYNITYYHGGLDGKEKVYNQDLFKHNQANIMVATNSFGMGVDLPNIRVIILYDIPLSVSECVQELGRAGRDGKNSLGYIILSNKSLYKANLLISKTKNIKANEDKLDDVLKFALSADKNEFLLKYFMQKRNKKYI